MPLRTPWRGDTVAGPRTTNLRGLEPVDLLGPSGLPTSVSEWKAIAGELLTDEACTFHRNIEISACYAWMYRQLPSCFKWAAMAALASHHIRLALAPFRSEGDRHGPRDVAQVRARRWGLLAADTDVIRRTNNGIFDDIYWVHLAFLASGLSIDYLRELLTPEPSYAGILHGFERIEVGRTSGSVTEVWQGNVELLRHEQVHLVQPCFDTLSSTYAQLISMGAATSFGVRGMRDRSMYFTSFYVSALSSRRRGQAATWPRITSLQDRWRWLTTSVVPRFQTFESRPAQLATVLDRILEEDDYFTAHPCKEAVSSSTR